VGYASVSAFNRAFIREMRNGPGEYRHAARAGARPVPPLPGNGT
jgi:AraC-like DNA-binding protein